MNAVVLGLAIAAITVVALLLLWIFLLPAKRPSSPAKAAPSLPSKRKASPAKAAARPRAVVDNRSSGEKTEAAASAAEAPSVEVPKNASSARWVGKMIDEHPDEAAAVLRRWIQEK